MSFELRTSQHTACVRSYCDTAIAQLLPMKVYYLPILCLLNTLCSLPPTLSFQEGIGFSPYRQISLCTADSGVTPSIQRFEQTPLTISSSAYRTAPLGRYHWLPLLVLILLVGLLIAVRFSFGKPLQVRVRGKDLSKRPRIIGLLHR